MGNSYRSLEEITAENASLRQRIRELESREESVGSNQPPNIVPNREELFKAIIATSQEWIWSIDAEGRYTFSNPAIEHILDYPPEEFLGKRIAHLLQEDDRPIIRETLSRSIKEKRGWTNLVLRRQCRDGSYHYLESNAVPIIDRSGHLMGFQGADRDITDRKGTEQALRQSEATLRSVFTATPVGLCIMKNRVYQSANKAWCEGFGYTESELIGHTTQMLYESAAEYGRVGRDLYESLLKKGLTSVQTRLRRKDGVLRDVILIAAPLQPEDLSIGTVVAIQDITDYRQATEKLRESRRQFADIIEFLPDATLVIDRESRVIAWNRAMEKMTGIKAKQMIGKGDYEYALPFYGERRPILIDLALHPQPEMESKYTEIQRFGDILFGEAYTPSLPSGNIHLSATASVLRNARGEIMAAIECIRDNTERKQLEKDRQENLERLRKSLGGTVQAIASLVETRDPYTAGHQRRVADLSRAIATEMGLSHHQIDGLRIASTIHDLGKISVPAEILTMPRKLTDIEFSLMKTHAQSGYDILKDINFPWPVARMVLEHHERMDGSGYPHGLTGEELLLESRILMVADVVEAIASHRPYRPGMGFVSALEEITNNRGVLYDREVVDACLRLFREKGYKIKS